MNKKLLIIIKTVILPVFFMLLLIVSPLRTEASEETRTSSQSFSADHNLTGISNTFSEYFSTGNWEIESLNLQIVLSTTQLLSRYEPEFTVSVNNEPVYTEVLKASDGGRYTISIDCPASCVKSDSMNSVSFNIYLRTTSEDACGDEASNANWINFYKDSSMNITYRSLNQCDTVSSVYDQLSSIDALENNESAILVNGSGDEILQAASRSAGALYQNADLDGQNLELYKYSPDLLSEYRTILLFSSYDELPSEIKPLLSAQEDALAQSGGAAAVIRYNDCCILLITGSSNEALSNSGLMLSNTDYMRQLTSDYTEISDSDIYTTDKPKYEEYISLSDSDTYVHGYYHHSSDFYIDWPANRKLAESSQLSLAIRYSDNIDFGRSLVTVYINNTPIGSKQLTADEADSCLLDLNIPSDVVINGKFTVSVAFDLEPSDETWCRTNPDNAPWAYITRDSMLKLTSLDRTDLSFKSYPAPFIRDGIYNNLMIVLPEDPDNDEIKTLGRVSCTLGKFLNGNTGTLLVTTNPDDTAMSDCNIIFIGTGKRNQFVSTHSDLLSIAYNDSASSFVSNSTVTLSPDYGSLIGMCELLSSPYSAADESHSVMIISGANGTALLRAASFIGDYDKLSLLSGDTFIADDDNAYCYTFIDGSDVSESTGLDTVQKTTVINILLISALILILCGISLTLLIYKYKKKNGGPK